MTQLAARETAPHPKERRTQAARRSEAEHSILNAAIRLVSEHGVERLTLADVGEAAGYSRGLPAHYFGSKEGLIVTIADQILRDFRHDVMIVEKHEIGLKHLLGIAAHYFDSAAHDPVRARALFVILGAAFHNDTLNSKIAELNKRSAKGIEENIKAGIAAGDISKSIKPDVQSSLILCALRGTTSHWLLNQKECSLKTLKAEFIASLKRVLQA